MKTAHPISRLARCLLALAFTGWVGSRSLHAQGSLTPPAGPPVPGMKTLDQIEPRTPVNATTCPGDASFQFIIKKPGSYYLTGDLLGESGKSGIYITVPDVVLDLNGFTLTGVPGASRGIQLSSPNAENTVLRNGIVRNWSNFGILAYGIRGLRCSHITCKGNGGNFGGGMGMGSGAIEDCNFIDNVTSGLWVEGYAIITKCVAISNANTGFVAISGSSTFVNCTASLNQTGFSMNMETTASGCTAAKNQLEGFSGGKFLNCVALENGLSGFNLDTDSRANGCTAQSNGTSGFKVADRCLLEACSAFDNALIGISGGQYTTLSHCSVAKNKTDGIHTEEYSTLLQCNASTNAANGIVTGSYAQIDGCTASENSQTGISCGANATLRHCTVAKNKTDGIHALADASISHCTAAANAENGIATGTYALIEECQALRNGVDGIQLAGGSLVKGCLASRNGVAGAAAGIRAGGSGSSIEGNSTRDNVGTGILSGLGNIIIRNRSGGNSVNNYTPANGAGFAPVESPATQTNPSANF